MARLPQMAPRLTAARPALAAPKDEAGRSRYKRDVKGHSLYNNRRWRGTDAKHGTDGLRYRVLLDALFTCAMCGRIDEPRNMVADHKVAHRGDPSLFWDRDNLQALCGSCHSGAKQRIERAEGMT